MTDARVSREHVEALVKVSAEVQVSREHVEALVKASSDVQVSREYIEVLYSEDGKQHIWPGQATETDEALPLAVVERRRFIVGLATETDEAQPITAAFPVNVATETDEAIPLGVALTLGVAEETDTARPVTALLQLGQPTETDEAGAVYIEWVSNPSGAVDGFGWTSGHAATPGDPYIGSYLSRTGSPPAGAPFPTAVFFNGSAVPGTLVQGGYWADPTDGEFALVGTNRRVTVEVWLYLDGTPGDSMAGVSFKNWDAAQTGSTGIGMIESDIPVGQWVHYQRTFVTSGSNSKMEFEYEAGSVTGTTTVLYMAGLSIRTEPTYTQTLTAAKEIDSAQPITLVAPSTTVTVGQATETDEALPVLSPTVVLNRADETDTAQPITVLQPAYTVSVAEELDLAFALVLLTRPSGVVGGSNPRYPRKGASGGTLYRVLRH